MNTVLIQFSKKPINLVRLVCSAQKLSNVNCSLPQRFGTTVDAIDAFTLELLQRQRDTQVRNSFLDQTTYITFFEGAENVDTTTKDASNMSIEDLGQKVEALMTNNKDKQLIELLSGCHNTRKILSGGVWNKLFRNYSILGKPDMIVYLQKVCSKSDPNLYKRNGEFLHYLAKAQCMKGNSEKGLFILVECYRTNVNLRSFYRNMFRELIQDTVLNRSEASLVIFKKYILEFSRRWEDHYPLVCFWHICWSSSWFSDQMLSNELLEVSSKLRDIVRDKATAFSLSVLKMDYNEDAVVRLLQALLKYEMMDEYVKVLQVLFNHKLRNKDLRGCTEILRNCEALGVTLPSDQQGRYIRLLIGGKQEQIKQPTVQVPPSKNFKLKF